MRLACLFALFSGVLAAANEPVHVALPYAAPLYALDVAILDGPGEAVVGADTVALRLPQPRAAVVRVISLGHGQGDTRTTVFSISATEAAIGPGSRRITEGQYEQARSQYRERFAWPREDVANLRLLAKAGGIEDHFETGRRGRRGGQELMDLFLGTRALAENLQLDRTLPLRSGELVVPIDTLPGITIRPIDWSGVLAAQPRPASALAQLIPADQHTLSFPTFAALTTISDAIDRRLGELMSLYGGAADAGVRTRLQHQLGLDLSALGRALGPVLIEEIAVTGSDPFVRLGSDVAVIFRTKDVRTLRLALTARQTLAQAGEAASGDPAVAISGTVDGIAWSGIATADRRVSSLIAEIGGHIVVANSPVPLQRLAATLRAPETSLAASDDYRFLHHRHGAGQAELIITDAAIRRWCSAASRIGDARRLGALSALSAMQIDWVHAGALPGATIAVPERWRADLGVVVAGPQGVRSASFGSTSFLTPLSERPVTMATAEEADDYRRFVDAYQRRWSAWFDPIGASASVDGDRLRFGLELVPLIDQTDYDLVRRFAGSASIAAGAGDAHDALLHLIFAIDHTAKEIRDAGRDLGGMVGIAEPFAWIGPTVELFVDDDALFDRMAASDRPHQVVEQEHWRLPIALRVSVRSPLRLTAFLAAVRTSAEQEARGNAEFQNREHAGMSYVAITPVRDRDMPSIFYAAVPGALIVTPHEGVLHRALARQQARQAAAATAPAQDFLGDHAGVSCDAGRLLELRPLWRRLASRMTRVSNDGAWLPVLTYLARKFPGQDAIALHRRFFAEAPADPARYALDPATGGYRLVDATVPPVRGRLDAGLSFLSVPLLGSATGAALHGLRVDLALPAGSR